MVSPSQDNILQALQSVIDPDTNENIVESRIASDIQISHDGQVVLLMSVAPERGASLEPLRQKAENTIAQIQGVTKATAILTAERENTPPPSPSRNPHPTPAHIPLPHIKHVIAVASGKGGVGKSTISTNLAIALGNRGLNIGLLDADIYGPSQPRMAGLSGQKPEMNDHEQIVPLTAHGIKVMSIGFMVAEEKAMIWRGPMVQSALVQLLRDVEWGIEEKPLDVLIVDMPPGTGDTQLTMAQKIDLSGAVIVSTPQDIALIDARKGIQMFEAVDVPILGLIENMSTYICPSCGHEDHIFGHGGAAKEADARNIPLLGEIPLNLEIRSAADQGIPLSQAVPKSNATKVFEDIAEKIDSRFGLSSIQ